jgi:hypothetical protein
MIPLSFVPLLLGSTTGITFLLNVAVKLGANDDKDNKDNDFPWKVVGGVNWVATMPCIAWHRPTLSFDGGLLMSKLFDLTI